MPSILEILNERTRARKSAGVSGRGGLRSGLIIRTNGPRYVVNDGVNAVTCDSLVSERLQQGDRVWIGEAAGATLILGIQGRDVDFA